MTWSPGLEPERGFLVPRVDQNNDSNIGSSTNSEANSNSASTLLSTLVPVAAFAGVYLIVFVILRKKYQRWFMPRTFMGSLRPEARSPESPTTLFGWVGAMYQIPDTYILNHHSMDAYLLLRFLKVAVVSCLVGCCITWPVLFPINITGGGGHSQLDILTFANVKNNYYKLFAHAGCAIIFFTFLLWQITRECIFYINLRQAYLMSPLYASRLSSRTVLFASVPPAYMNVERMRGMLGPGVRRVWLASDVSKLEDLVKQRDKAALKLEAAETKLIVTANKNRLKAEKKGGASATDGQDGAVATALDGGESGSVASRWLDPKQRPTHRLKPLIGQKVDTIDWCRAELQKLVPEIEHEQAIARSGEAKLLSSAFVEFETQSEAQSAYQSLTHHQILHMSPRFIGMTPGEVIWSNLRIQWWERVVRHLGTLAFITALIIFWSIPVAFVGAISNVNYLVQIIPAFKFILDIPQVVLGVVTGLLPSILLAVLMALLPIILRLMAKLGGDPTNSAVELTVQNYYFAFQVVQVFLVATLGSAASSVVQSIIDDPTSATTLLANRLPLASNFYLSYFVLQGLGVVASILVGLVGLILFYVLGRILDSTPRKMYRRWINLSGLGWGTVFPIYTNLFVIGICYAVVAPLVLIFAAVGLYFFYFAYRYNFLYVSNMQIDTKGRVYPRALQHLFVGIYIAELCLIGLFAIAVGTSIGALGPLILMIVMLVFTVLYHISLNSALGPLINYLPKTLEYEEESLMAAERDTIEKENAETFEQGDAAASHAQQQQYQAAGPLPPIDSGAGLNGIDVNGAQDGAREKGDIEHEAGASRSAKKKARAQARATSSAASPDRADGATAGKKPNFFQKWLRPDRYTDYATMRKLVPRDIEIEYTPDIEEDAYFNPAISSATPLLWIPRDSMGVSAQEVRETGKVTAITDEGAFLNEKGKVTWHHEDDRPPIYEEKVYY